MEFTYKKHRLTAKWKHRRLWLANLNTMATLNTDNPDGKWIVNRHTYKEMLRHVNLDEIPDNVRFEVV